MQRKTILNLLVIFFLLFSLYPFNIDTALGDPPVEIFLIETSEDYTNYGFTDLGVYYTNESLTCFHMPFVVERTGVFNNLEKQDLDKRLDKKQGSYDKRLRGYDFDILDSNENYYVVDFSMDTRASNKSFSVDFIPKIKNFEFPQFAWWNSTWDYYVNITINSSYFDSTLTDFTILVNITDTLGDQCDSGNSIRFTKTDNITELDYEIEKWEDGSERIVWVKIPSISHTTDTYILMYYNNSGASDAQDQENTWDNNYVGVFHFDNASGDLMDSTGTQNGAVSGTPLYRQTGSYGWAIEFDGSTDWFNITNDAYKMTNDWTIETWFNCDVHDGTNHVLIYIGDISAGKKYTQVYKRDTDLPNDGMAFYSHTGVTSDVSYSDLVGWDICDNWYYLGGIHDGDGGGAPDGTRSYVNETLQTSDDHANNINLGSGTPFVASIGTRDFGTPYYWDGWLEEVRVTDGLRSDDWLQSTFHTTNMSHEFLIFGSPIPNPDENIQPENLTATTSSKTLIVVNWTSGSNADSTLLERNSASDWSRGSGTQLYNGTNEIYNDTYTGFSCGTYYYYRAWGYNTTNNFWSNSDFDSNITCPTNPTSITATAYVGAVNFTWVMGTYADNTTIVRKANTFPTGPTDGTEIYNGSGLYYNDTSSLSTHRYMVYSWNDTVDQFSSGVQRSWGGLTINVYDENTSSAVAHWDVFITDDTGDNTYESLNNSNSFFVDVTYLPYGDDVVIIINSTGYSGPWYNSKVFVMDLAVNTQYTLDAYLSETNASELYFLYVTNELDEPVPDASMNIRRYINDSVGYGNASIMLTDANGEVSVYLVPDELYLVVITKDGYETETSTFRPDPDYYGPYYPKEFKLLFSTTAPTVITFNDIIDFTATIDSSGYINVTYYDQNSRTTDTQIQIHQSYNRTFTWNDTDSRTGDNSFTFTSSGYNTSMMHRVTLYLNHSDLGYEHVTIFLFPIVSTMAESTIEEYWTDVFGSWDLGYVKTFVIFLPALFFLVVFGAGHTGLGILVSGLYLGFTTVMLDVTSVISYVTLGSLLAIAGIVMIIVKRGRHSI